MHWTTRGATKKVCEYKNTRQFTFVHLIVLNTYEPKQIILYKYIIMDVAKYVSSLACKQ